LTSLPPGKPLASMWRRWRPCGSCLIAIRGASIDFRQKAAGLFLDYSKNRITDKTMNLLLDLAREADVAGRIEAMFSGARINTTENRAVLHVALRADKRTSPFVSTA
jgi:hypothetical protein